MICAPRGTRAQDSVYESDTADRRSIGNVGLHVGRAKARGAEKANTLGGVHLELMPLSWFGVQVAGDYASEERFPFKSPNFDTKVKVRTTPVTLSAKLYAPFPRIQPYAVVGAGWYHQQIDFSRDLENLGFKDRKDTPFGWNLGLGLAASLSSRIGVFAEARWIFLDPERDLDQFTVNQIEDFDYDTFYAGAGLSLLF